MTEIATRAETSAPVAMSATEARALTDQIKVGVEATWHMISRAYTERAWTALGYESWDDYCTREFGTSRLRLPREERQEVVSSLRESGLSLRAIESATGISRKTVVKDLTESAQVVESTPPGEPEVVASKRAGGAPGPHTPGQTDRVAQALAKANVRAEFAEAATALGVDTAEIGDYVAMAEVSSTAFDEVIVEARNQDDLSRDNVVELCRTRTSRPTEASKVVGRDGKNYQKSTPKPKPKRRPLTAQSGTAGWDLMKAAERIERIIADDRFEANKAAVASDLRGHLTMVLEKCQQVLDRLPAAEVQP